MHYEFWLMSSNTPLSTQPYKGTRDFYPEDKRIQNWMFARLREVAASYGYQEYDGPLLESFDLYAAKTGAEIVNQQLYHFVDRGDRKVAIRPEMTPTLARMVAAKIQELPKPVRWFSLPNLWRYERPQRGRLREHWQLNVDVLGGDTVLADAEILMLARDLFVSFGAGEKISIQLNNRRLMDHLFLKVLSITHEAALELSKALDARAKLSPEAFDTWLNKAGLNDTQKATLNKFLAMDFAAVHRELPCEGSQELASLIDLLSKSGAQGQVVFDPSIMRGMDYYTGTVFEAYDVSPENRRALFGGGRYDNLVGMFGKNKLSGMGFGLGDVPLRDFLETHKLLPATESFVDVLVTTPTQESLAKAHAIAAQLRAAGFRTITTLGVDGFGGQLKLASKQGARFAILLGQDELGRGEVGVKNLITGEQKSVKDSDLIRGLKS